MGMSALTTCPVTCEGTLMRNDVHPAITDLYQPKRK